MADTPTLRTLGQVAKFVGAPIHKVDYAVKAYRITESCRAAHFRMFDDAKVDAIRAALRRIAERNGSLA